MTSLAAEVQLLSSLTQLLTTVVLPPDPLDCGRRNQRGILGACVSPEDLAKKPFTRGNISTAWFGEFPWLVSLQGAPPNTKGSALSACSGVLVNQQAVLTSGACYKTALERGWKLTARLADYNINSEVEFGRSPDDIGIATAIFHPEFRLEGTAVAYDVAVLILERPVSLETDVGIVCLPWWSSLQRLDTLSDDWEKAECIIAGWSDPRQDLGSTIFYQGTKFLSRSSCHKKLREMRRLGPFAELHASFACSEPDEGCWADVGTPLVCRNSRKTDRWTLVGMVPFSRLYESCDGAVTITSIGKVADWIQTTVSAQLSVSA